jgi:hypothetical protein
MGQAVRVGVSRLAGVIARCGPVRPALDLRKLEKLEEEEEYGCPADSAHPGTAAGHLRCGLAAPLAARLDSHDPLAELARHLSVELDLGRVGPTTVATVPVSNDGLHGRSLSRRRPATDAYQKGGAGPSEGSEEKSLSRGSGRGPLRRRSRPGGRVPRFQQFWELFDVDRLDQVVVEARFPRELAVALLAEPRESDQDAGGQTLAAAQVPGGLIARLLEEGQDAGARVGWGGGGTVWRGVGGTGAGVPSIPRTRPAGVRRTTTGVVSGVGGAGSGVCFSVVWAARCPFEQPRPRMKRATTARAAPIRFIVLLPLSTTFVASGFESLTHFGAPAPPARRK